MLIKHIKKLSLRWRLTLLTALLVSTACIVSNIIISTNAMFKIKELENMAVEIVPYEVNLKLDVDSDVLKKEFKNSEKKFWEETIISTFFIVMVSCSIIYIMLSLFLKPLEKLTKRIEDINEKNLSDELEIDTDISEIRKLIIAFNEMLERLNEIFAAQKRFSASAAHEMKTPLAVIKTRLAILKKSEKIDESDYMDSLNMLDNQVTRLSGVIDVLLQMVSLNSIKREEEVFLGDLIEELIFDLDFIASEKNISLNQHGENIKILGNYNLIYRAIYNLLENAIKYNHENGCVDINIVLENKNVNIFIKDTCEKIAKEYSEKIFEPFYRIDKSRSRQLGGAGLGLALVKEIVVKHGGSICLLDTYGDGNMMKLSFKLEE